MRISDWSSDVCSSDLRTARAGIQHRDVLEQLHHIVARRLARSIGPGGISISGQIVPPRTARGFRIGCDHPDAGPRQITPIPRSEEHTSELQSLMRISYAVFCLTKKNKHKTHKSTKVQTER